jgi:CheY-like chemotaxis protein
VMKPLKRIMLIDDDEVSSYIFSKLITISNFAKQIQSFNNAKEALEFLKKHAGQSDRLPEIIFLDLILFDMDGWAFLDQFELLDKSVRDKIHLVILTTSFYEKDKIKASNYSSVKKFIQKPITTDHLMEILEDFKKKIALAA